MSVATYNITADSGVNVCETFKEFEFPFHQILMVTELEDLFMLV